MKRPAFAVAALALVPLLALAGRSLADDSRTETDANLVTALDLSDSIMRHEEWIEFDGLARAVTDREFLSAIAEGRLGRIGFAAFIWSNGRDHQMIVPWRVIAGPADAEQVRVELGRARDRLRFAHRMGGRWRAAGAVPAGLTDLSSALDLATTLALSAPYPAARTVINICGNGEDNVGVAPDQARDKAVAFGFVVNGLVLGAERGVAAYYRGHVQGGAGSFVLEVKQPGAVAQAFVDKFLRDLIAGPRSDLIEPFS